jgi:hypothetical protein
MIHYRKCAALKEIDLTAARRKEALPLMLNGRRKEGREWKERGGAREGILQHPSSSEILMHGKSFPIIRASGES